MNKYFISIFCICFLSFSAFSQYTELDSAIDFDASKYNRVKVPDVPILNPNQVAFEAWVKPKILGAKNSIIPIIDKFYIDKGVAYGYGLSLGENGQLSFYYGDSASSKKVILTTSSTIEKGQWNHVAAGIRGDSMVIFINGVLVASSSPSAWPVLIKRSPWAGLTFGYSEVGSFTGFFDGMVDEVKVWSDGMSNEMIPQWMCRKVTKQHPNYKNLIGYWKFNMHLNDFSADSSKYNNPCKFISSAKLGQSDVAIGDTSVFTNNSSKLSLVTKFGDVMTVKNISGSPSYFHLVGFYSKTRQKATVNVIPNLDSTHYFSVFYPTTTKVNYDIDYKYSKSKQIDVNQKCGITLLGKSMKNAGNWDYLPHKIYSGGDSLVIKNQTNLEFLPAYYNTDSNRILYTSFNSNWFCYYDSIKLLTTGNDSFTYRWYHNGSELNSKTKSFLYANKVGDYKMQMTRKGTNCSIKSTPFSVSSKGGPVTWNFNIDACNNHDSISLPMGQPSGGDFSGLWISKNNYFHPEKSGKGDFKLSYNFTDSIGCFGSASLVAKVKDTSLLTIKAFDPACKGQANILLNHVSPQGGTYTGDWVNANSFDLKNTSLGNKTITYTYLNSNNCVSKAVLTLKVNKSDSISVKIKDRCCVGEAPINIQTYPSGGSVKHPAVLNNTFFPAFANKGFNRMYFLIKDSHQCDLKDSADIYVSDYPKAGIDKMKSLCENDADLLLSSGQPKDSGKYYFMGKEVKSFSPKIIGNGLHKIEYKVINYYGCRDSASTQLRVNAAPPKPIIIKTGNELKSSESNRNQWYYENTKLEGINTQNFLPTKDGYYQVMVTNDSNCSNISDSFLFMKTGIKQSIKTEFEIYPNPSHSGIVYIKGATDKRIDIEVKDGLGKTLFLLEKMEMNQAIDLSKYGTGTFILTVRDEDKWINYKVVIL